MSFLAGATNTETVKQDLHCLGYAGRHLLYEDLELFKNTF